MSSGALRTTTVGARKAKIVYALLSWSPCPISKLVIDLHCALALFHLVDTQQIHKFMSREGKYLADRKEHWSAGTRTLIPLYDRH